MQHPAHYHHDTSTEKNVLVGAQLFVRFSYEQHERDTGDAMRLAVDTGPMRNGTLRHLAAAGATTLNSHGCLAVSGGWSGGVTQL